MCERAEFKWVSNSSRFSAALARMSLPGGGVQGRAPGGRLELGLGYTQDRLPVSVVVFMLCLSGR
jgi:hypothetical protein